MQATKANDSKLHWKQRTEGFFVREWLPSGQVRGGVLCLHGMESHSGWFNDLAIQLNGLGWAVACCDRPGWGKSPGPCGHLESYKEFVARTCVLASDARAKFGSVHLLGMSWGGMASLYFALRRGWLIDSLTLLAPGLAVRTGIPFFEKMRIASSILFNDRRAVFTPAFSVELFSDNAECREFIANDPYRIQKVTASFCLETLKMRDFIKNSVGKKSLPPAQCLLGGRDKMIDNDAVAALCRKAGMEIAMLPEASHALALEHPLEVAERFTRLAARAGGMREKGKRVWMLGGGAVGGVVGSLLAFAGNQVGVLVKPKHKQTIGNKNFTLMSPESGREVSDNLFVVDKASALPSDPDLIVVAVKSFDTSSMLRLLKETVPAGTAILSLQNGLANEAVIAEAFPDNPLAAGVICAGMELVSPGNVLWAGDRGGIGAAAYRGDSETMRATLEGILPTSGMEHRWYEGSQAAKRLKWSKLMLNIAFNALNSLTGLSSAEILGDRRYCHLAFDAMSEGFKVMDGMKLEPYDLPGYPVGKLRLLTKVPALLALRVLRWQAARTPDAAFSMRQDIVKKRGRTEIDDLNGVVVKHGRDLGIEVTANEMICRLVEDMLAQAK